MREAAATVLFHPDYNRRLRNHTESADPSSRDEKKALAGLGYVTLTAGGDFHPALRTSAARNGRPVRKYDQTPRHRSKRLWHGETACPHAAGNRAAAPYLLEVRSRRQTSRTDAELDPRSFLRSLIEAEADLRAVKPEVLQFAAIEMAQHRQRSVTLATRNRGRHQAIDKAARARQKNGGSAPCNWRGSGGQDVFKNSHSAIFQVAGATVVRASAVGTASICPTRKTKDFQSAVIYRPDWLEIGRLIAEGPKSDGPRRRCHASAHGDIFTDP